MVRLPARVLFVDDSSTRLHRALEIYSDCELRLATNVKECLRFLARYDYDLVSLDHDLNGADFQDPDEPTSGMEVVRYLEKTGWPVGRKKPEFVIHSSNNLAAGKMVKRLSKIGFGAKWAPFGWKKYQHGAVAGAFDVLHLGYVRLLEEAKRHCHKVSVLIHDKPEQVFSVEVRKEIVLALESVDNVLVYRTEDQLTNLLNGGVFDVRIVGSDHAKQTSRPDLEIPTIYHERGHGWSATEYKKMIVEKCFEMSVSVSDSGQE